MNLIEKKRMLMGVGFTEEQSIMLIMILHNMASERPPLAIRDDQVRMMYRKVQSKIHNKEQMAKEVLKAGVEDIKKIFSGEGLSEEEKEQ